MTDRYDVLYKVVLVGDLGVGKTSILQRYKFGVFEENYKATIGVDFTVQTLKIDNKTVKLQIWDTSGQERFKAMIPKFYRDAHAALIVFDVTNTESFEGVGKWLQDVNYFSGLRTTSLLLGNKCDLINERKVKLCDAQSFALRNDMLDVIETSAKENSNIDEAFLQLSKELLKREDYISLGSMRPSLTLDNSSPAESSWWGCC